ncbi:MAG: hypothetical protein OXT65_06700 [Alphaproteobacteria bacterium]|nr:hypothetical protein [Alphaproteobacteria bacterium]
MPVIKAIRPNRNSDDLIIKAHVWDKGTAQIYPISFKESRIDFLAGLKDGWSLIALQSGIKIPVAMPLKELQSAIYQPKSDTLDLLDRTTIQTTTPTPDSLTDSFANASAKPIDIPAEVPLTLHLIVYDPEQKKYAPFTVAEAEIEWSRVKDYWSENRSYIYAPLKNTVNPFGHSYIRFQMHENYFRNICNRAKLQGIPELNLRKMTTPKHLQDPITKVDL